MKKILGSILGLLLALILGIQGLSLETLGPIDLDNLTPESIFNALTSPQGWYGDASLEDIPEYSGTPYVYLEGNVPFFLPEELLTEGKEEYSPLDLLGRCGPAFAVVGPETMPTEERGAIGQVKPSGWHLAKYDCVDGKYLYNRCHLIGYQLTGENANERNLITGTRYLNVEGMLPFENQVADYVEKTGNHVAYRVTPIFEEGELVARGVQMQAQSVEDGGAGVRFNLFVYNVQPGVEIDYATGKSWLAEEEQETPTLPEITLPQLPEITLPDVSLPDVSLPDVSLSGPSQSQQEEAAYIINRSSGRFHLPTCAGAVSMSELNRQPSNESRDALVGQGYLPCGQCKP